MYKLIRGENFEDISRKVAEYIINKAQEHIETKGSFNIALAGGTTPVETYRILGESEMEWDKINFFLTDERYVPLDDERSNYRMIRGFLGEKANIFPFDTSKEIRETCRLYTEVLKKHAPLDFILLGAGTDGHTASLFPNSVWYDDDGYTCWTVDPTGLKRVSLSLKFINSSKEVALFLTGEKKRSILEKILKGENLPASKVRSANGETIIFTDIDI